MKVPIYYWFVAFFYFLVIYFSNFAELTVIKFLPPGLAFWLFLFIFSACLGFIISYLFGLKSSLIIVGLSWLINSLISIIILLANPSYFGLETSFFTSITTQTLKITFATVFGIFGMLIWQNIYLAKELVRTDEKVKFYEKNLLDAKKEAELMTKEAEVKSNEMILEAKKKVQELEKLRRDIEIKIREFLQVEMAVLDKHEENLKENKE